MMKNTIGQDFVRTLYVTDLDGTLLREDKSISDTTIEIINELIDRGAMITYATARSIYSASVLTERLRLSLPVITRNGVVLADPATKREIEIMKFEQEEIEQIRKIYQTYRLRGFVTAYVDGRERMSYIETDKDSWIELFLQDHPGDERMRPVLDDDALFEGEISYFTFIGEKDKLDPVYERIHLCDQFVCEYQKDKYSESYWLELCPKGATKASAVCKLKERYCCEQVVVFGDSLNDLSMFEIADEAYAVGNAMDEVKKQATGVIAGNEDDGVAEWLRARLIRPFH